MRMLIKLYPLSPASKASRKVANVTERKNLHTPLYGVKEFVCLSVFLLQTLTPIIYLFEYFDDVKFMIKT